MVLYVQCEFGSGRKRRRCSALQTALQNDGESVNPTGTFDDQTASAVSGFQEKYSSNILVPNNLKYGTGYVGAATRAELNALFGCGGSGGTQPTTVAPTPTVSMPALPTSVSSVPTEVVPGRPSNPTMQAFGQALMQQLQALQSQSTTPETQARINAILMQLKAQNQSGGGPGTSVTMPTQTSGATQTSVTVQATPTMQTPTPYMPPTAVSTVQAPYQAGTGTSVSFDGYTWTPVNVSYDSFSSLGIGLLTPQRISFMKMK